MLATFILVSRCNLNILRCVLNRPKLTFQTERHIAGLNRHLLSNRPKSLLNLTKVLNSAVDELFTFQLHLVQYMLTKKTYMLIILPVNSCIVWMVEGCRGYRPQLGPMGRAPNYTWQNLNYLKAQKNGLKWKMYSIFFLGKIRIGNAKGVNYV